MSSEISSIFLNSDPIQLYTNIFLFMYLRTVGGGEGDDGVDRSQGGGGREGDRIRMIHCSC